MQITLNINDNISDKILFFLEHFQDDIKIISKIETPLNIEQISKGDPDYQIILKGRKERKNSPANYGTLDDINWNQILYKIIPHKKVIKFINSRIPKEKKQIKQRFDELAKNPYPTNPNLNIKKMSGLNGFRLRIGGYRFIYDVVDSELIIYMEQADNRGDIY